MLVETASMPGSRMCILASMNKTDAIDALQHLCAEVRS